MPEGAAELLPGKSETRRKSSKEGRILSEQEKEIKGVWLAIHDVDRLAKDKRKSIDEQTVRGVHSRLMSYYHPEVAGRYRDFDVEVTDASFSPPHWSQVKYLMWQFGKELSQRTATADHSFTGMEKTIEVSAWAHYRIAQIHPFGDGNGRTARLLTDLIFKRAGLYYITDWGSKDQYVNALEKVNQSGDIDHFGRYLAGKLALRYENIASDLIKSPVAQLAKKSPVISDLLNRKQRLIIMSREPASA